MKSFYTLFLTLFFIVSCSKNESIDDVSMDEDDVIIEIIPKEVADNYQTEIDWNISDDFNPPTLDFDKWEYRRPDRLTGDGRKYVIITDEGYLSVKCDVSDKKGGGVSGLNYCRFGFFITKFKIEGIKTGNQKSHTHPAIWGYRYNMGEKGYNAPVEGNDWMELDWVEYYAWSKVNCWDIDAPPNINKIRYKELRSIMLEHDVKTDFGDWETVGLEYHPDYIQAWELVDEKWQKLGKRIPAGDVQSKDVMKRSCMQNMHWIISNGYFGHANGTSDDSYFYIDYFHYYPLKL